jgi:diguanylate cyclase (GGDEF)-like protein
MPNDEAKPYKIMVVDDEEHIRRILQFQLKKEAYTVITAPNGEEALRKIRQESPDLVILDVMMPKIDGFEVCRRIRSDFQISQIPIIMLTAKSDLPDRVKGLKDGANDYLIKPYSNEELLLRVKNVLEWSQNQKEANPLTGFAGNRAIEKKLQTIIKKSEPFAFLYLDIDNFKAYNDCYGYRKGDDAILFLADIISETVNSLGGASDFIGHIGGDDFVVITSPERSESMARRIIDEFDKGSLVLLKEEDIRKGYFEVETRVGEHEQVPLMSLTIALVVDRDNRLKHFARVSDIASELKKFGKSMNGSVVVRERRKKKSEAEQVSN